MGSIELDISQSIKSVRTAARAMVDANVMAEICLIVDLDCVEPAPDKERKKPLALTDIDSPASDG